MLAGVVEAADVGRPGHAVVMEAGSPMLLDPDQIQAQALVNQGGDDARESVEDFLGALVPGKGSGMVVPGLDPVAVVLGER